MPSVGLVGGLGPESTIDYYRRILEAWQRDTPSSAPSIVIDSLDVQQAIRFVQGDRPGLVEYLLGSLRRLAGAGVDFVAISANTPHIVFDDVRKQSPIPLLSIVEATCDATYELGLKTVGLLGTRFTMQGRFYPEVFGKKRIQLVVPDADEQEYVHDHYMSELVQGIFLPKTRERVLAIVDQMKLRDGIQGVILGGTELPLLFRDAPGPGLPILDTTKIHVERAVALLLSESDD